MNEHWTRWIHASLAKYFKEFAKPKGVPLFIEAEVKAPDKLNDKVEMRWDGPYCRQLTRTQWTAAIEINMLVTSQAGGVDAYKHKKIVGVVQSMFTPTISVFKLGNLKDIDNEQLLGCLQLRSEDREAIVTSYFGKVGPDVTLEQSTVEAHYKMTLSTRS